MEKLRRDAMAFANQAWAAPLAQAKFPVLDYAPVVQKEFDQLTKGVTPLSVLIRACGQSGCGKSTQLFPTIMNGLVKGGLMPVHVTSRVNAEFHPFKNEIKETFGEESFRENTNQFAFIMSFLLLEKLIAGGYPVFFETTLCDPAFEAYLALYAAKHGYRVDYHLFSVARKISDAWIRKRFETSASEGHRAVSQWSVDFFYNTLEPALIRVQETAPRSNCTLWNVFDADPMFVGAIGDPKVLPLFKAYRTKLHPPEDKEDVFRESKRMFFETYYQSITRLSK